MNIIKISIIVPIYNIENYIEECVQSILRQTYEDIEVILVDDGSTDRSKGICQKYELMDKRVRLISKVNEGLSEARNEGLRSCTGKYVLFLDGDDYWEKDVLSDIVGIISEKGEKDIIIVDGYYGIFPNGKILDNTCNMNEEIFNANNGEEVLEYLFTYRNSRNVNWAWSAWRNIYKVDFLIQNKLFFKKGIICEDAEWTPKVILAAKRFGFFNNAFYMYRMNRPNSIMNVCSVKKIVDYLDTVDEWIKKSENIECENLSKVIKEVYSNNFCYYLNYVYLYDKNTRKMLIEKIRKSKFSKYVTSEKYTKYINAIDKCGYKPILIQLNFKYRISEYIKGLLVKVRLMDR